MDAYGAAEDDGQAVEQAFAELIEHERQTQATLAEFVPVLRAATEQMRRVSALDYDAALLQVAQQVQALRTRVEQGFEATQTATQAAAQDGSRERQLQADERGLLQRRLEHFGNTVDQTARIVATPAPPFPWLSAAAGVVALMILQAGLTIAAMHLVGSRWTGGAAPGRAASIDQTQDTGSTDAERVQAGLKRARAAVDLARYGLDLDRCRKAAAEAGQAVGCTLVIEPPPR